jgi:hypothetical protein
MVDVEHDAIGLAERRRSVIANACGEIGAWHRRRTTEIWMSIPKDSLAAEIFSD